MSTNYFNGNTIGHPRVHFYRHNRSHNHTHNHNHINNKNNNINNNNNCKVKKNNNNNENKYFKKPRNRQRRNRTNSFEVPKVNSRPNLVNYNNNRYRQQRYSSEEEEDLGVEIPNDHTMEFDNEDCTLLDESNSQDDYTLPEEVPCRIEYRNDEFVTIDELFDEERYDDNEEDEMEKQKESTEEDQYETFSDTDSMIIHRRRMKPEEEELEEYDEEEEDEEEEAQTPTKDTAHSLMTPEEMFKLEEEEESDEDSFDIDSEDEDNYVDRHGHGHVALSSMLNRHESDDDEDSTDSSPLSLDQINDIQNRELTPEDYELLLLLDSTVAPSTVPQSIVKSLPTDKLNAKRKELCPSCTICLTEFDDKQEITYLPICGHHFHTNCISKWLSISSTKCPLDGIPCFNEPDKE